MSPQPKPEDATRSDSMGFFNLGKGWTPLEYVLLVKCLDPEGNVKYRELTSRSLHPVEALGMVTTFQDSCRHKIMRDATRFRESE